MNKKLLPAKLKQLRIIHGYTQDYIASVLGISRQTYSHYETGKRTPSPDALFKLAGLYNISVDDLMQLTINIDRDISYDAPTPSQSSKDLDGFIEFFNNISNQKKFKFFNSLEKELFYYFNQLTDNDKEELIEFAKIKIHRYKKLWETLSASFLSYYNNKSLIYTNTTFDSLSS